MGDHASHTSACGGDRGPRHWCLHGVRGDNWPPAWRDFLTAAVTRSRSQALPGGAAPGNLRSPAALRPGNRALLVPERNVCVLHPIRASGICSPARRRDRPCGSSVQPQPCSLSPWRSPLLRRALLLAAQQSAQDFTVEHAGSQHDGARGHRLGQRIFRYDTFGDEQLWTDVLRMHEVLATVPPAQHSPLVSKSTSKPCRANRRRAEER